MHLAKLLRLRAHLLGPLTAAALGLPACTCPPATIVRTPESLQGFQMPPELTLDTCKQICGEHVRKCELVPMVSEPVDIFRRGSSNAPMGVLCTVPSHCPGGRRPAGFELFELPTGDLGAHFGELAQLEAASVHAFVELARELESHGAPCALVEALYRAAVEELEHARLTAQLARGYGTEPVMPGVTPVPVRDLVTILIDNAVEGLVHERYGAALAGLRAREAALRPVRAAMSSIAVDEARHAAIAEAIHAWGMPRISRAARGLVSEARERAVAEVHAAVAVEPTRELALTGMPSATRAVELFASVA